MSQYYNSQRTRGLYDPQKLTLEQAVQVVIDQNIDNDYNPTRFRSMVAGKDGDELKQIISNLVLKAELLEELEKVIKNYDNILTIEDLITEKKDGFGLSDEVIIQAKARLEYFDILRI